jgi:hypothetical protein
MKCGELIMAKGCTIYWNKGHNTLRILSPGFHSFAMFCAEAEFLDYDSDLIAHPMGVLNDDEFECGMTKTLMPD